MAKNNGLSFGAIPQERFLIKFHSAKLSTKCFELESCKEQDKNSKCYSVTVLCGGLIIRVNQNLVPDKLFDSLALECFGLENFCYRKV